MATGGCEVPCCFSKVMDTDKRTSITIQKRSNKMAQLQDQIKRLQDLIKASAAKGQAETGGEAEEYNELTDTENEALLPDFTNIDEVRKAFVFSEIINRKY